MRPPTSSERSRGPTHPAAGHPPPNPQGTLAPQTPARKRQGVSEPVSARASIDRLTNRAARTARDALLARPMPGDGGIPRANRFDRAEAVSSDASDRGAWAVIVAQGEGAVGGLFSPTRPPGGPLRTATSSDAAPPGDMGGPLKLRRHYRSRIGSHHQGLPGRGPRRFGPRPPPERPVAHRGKGTSEKGPARSGGGESFKIPFKVGVCCVRASANSLRDARRGKRPAGRDTSHTKGREGPRMTSRPWSPSSAPGALTSGPCQMPRAGKGELRG